MKTNLDSDMARCQGNKKEYACQTCARRNQIKIDDNTRFFPYMSHSPTNGVCIYRIDDSRSIGKQSGD